MMSERAKNSTSAAAGPSTRHARLPVEMVCFESHPSLVAALKREAQIKRWRAQKKAALAKGDRSQLHTLSRRRR
jgi:predicted GIY-YIG superfamily endonuclease